MARFSRVSGRICLALVLVLGMWWAAAPHPSLAQAAADCTNNGDNKPCFGPKSGTLTMDPTAVAEFLAGVSTSDFIATATFTNPYATSKGGWDYGIFFRRTDNGQDYRLVVRSTGDWVLDYGASASDLASGKLPTGLLDTTPTGKNGFSLVVSGNDALFFFNNTFISYLDVSEHTDAGDVAVVTNVYDSDYVKGGVTHYKNFTVWPSPLGGNGGSGSSSGGV